MARLPPVVFPNGMFYSPSDGRLYSVALCNELERKQNLSAKIAIALGVDPDSIETIVSGRFLSELAAIYELCLSGHDIDAVRQIIEACDTNKIPINVACDVLRAFPPKLP